MDSQRFQLKISSIKQRDDGDYEITFDLQEDFVSWFKKTQGLKKWSQKRFNKFMKEEIEKTVKKTNK